MFKLRKIHPTKKRSTIICFALSVTMSLLPRSNLPHCYNDSNSSVSNIIKSSSIKGTKRKRTNGGCHCSEALRPLFVAAFVFICIFIFYSDDVHALTPPTIYTSFIGNGLLHSHDPYNQRDGLDFSRTVPLNAVARKGGTTANTASPSIISGRRKERRSPSLKRNQDQYKQQPKQPAGLNYRVGAVLPMTRQALMNHDILTREEEHRLGMAIQRMRKIRKPLEQLLQAKEAERLKKLDEHRWRSLKSSQVNRLTNEDDDSDDEADDSDDDLWYISDHGIKHPKYTPLSTSFADNDYEQYMRETDSYTYLEEQERNSLVPPVWMYDEYTGSSSSTSTSNDDKNQYELENDSIASLTDEDVHDMLSLPGGKAELYKILVQGAMAREKLMRCNYRLVVSIAKRWAKQMSRNSLNDLTTSYSGGWDRPSLDEAIQEGVIGLSKAVDRFEPGRNLRFSTYATYWVTNSVRLCFQTASTGCFRVPVNFHDAKTKFKRLVKEYYQEYQEMPRIDQISVLMGLTQQRLELILQRTRPLLSIDAPLHNGASFTRAGKAGNNVVGEELIISDTLVDDDELSPDDRIELSFLRQSLERAMNTELAPHERDIIRLRLGLDDGVTRTAIQVSREFGGAVTATEVRATERRAYQKLRSPHSLARYKFLAYLDFAGVDKASISIRL